MNRILEAQTLQILFSQKKRNPKRKENPLRLRLRRKIRNNRRFKRSLSLKKSQRTTWIENDVNMKLI